MRLIDADVFEKFIKEKYKDGESTDDIKDQILFDLSYQPTAYDPEAVVAELESKKYWEYDDEGFSVEMVVSIGNAIEVVRKGGV